MKILFMGTPDFAVPCLDAICKKGYEVVGAVTQPDKPKGRGHKLVPPPVKELAMENDIEVFQPNSLKNDSFLRELQRLNPDLIVVVAYGKILPSYILDFPKFGCINVHASLLPKYRGAGPIQWAVINGEKTTGVTTMYMEEGLDTGDMILKEETGIYPDETAGELFDRLSGMGAELLIKTINRIEKGDAPREKQNDELSCYAPMISKETGHIDWNKTSEEIINLIRGTNPWPMSYSVYDGVPMKIIKAEKGNKCGDCCGKIISVDKNGICVGCGDGSVLIKEIQMQGGKRMSVESYLNGHTLNCGIVLE